MKVLITIQDGNDGDIDDGNDTDKFSNDNVDLLNLSDINIYIYII